MHGIIEDPSQARSMGVAAQARATELFSAQRSMAEWEQLIKSV